MLKFRNITAICGILVLLAGLISASADARVMKRVISGMRGGTFNSQVSQNRTGRGMFARSGNFGGTTTSGHNYGGSISGSGTRSFQQGQGYTRAYQGQVNTNNGNTYSVNRASTYSKNPDGGLSANKTKTLTTPNGQNYTVQNNATYAYSQGEGITKTGSKTLTNGEGQVLGTSTYNGNLSQGNGWNRSATVTGANGKTVNVSTTKQRTGDHAVQTTTTVTDGQGQTLGGVSKTAQYQYDPATGLQKTITGTTQKGKEYGWSNTSSHSSQP